MLSKYKAEKFKPSTSNCSVQTSDGPKLDSKPIKGIFGQAHVVMTSLLEWHHGVTGDPNLLVRWSVSKDNRFKRERRSWLDIVGEDVAGERDGVAVNFWTNGDIDFLEGSAEILVGD